MPPPPPPGPDRVKIQRGVGIEGLKRLNASGLSESEIKNPENIWKFFEDQLCSGKFTINVYHEKKKHPVLFYVVDVTGPAVIGLPTFEQLNIVTINVDQISPSVPTISSIDDLTHQYPK